MASFCFPPFSYSIFQQFHHLLECISLSLGILWWASNKMLLNILECISYCHDSLWRVPKNVSNHLLEFISLLHDSILTATNKLFCHLLESIYHFHDSLWRAPKFLLHHILEYIFLCLDVYSSDVFIEGVAVFILIYFPLLWFYAEIQIRCCTICFNLHSSPFILCIKSK